jgi:hypothetical protein
VPVILVLFAVNAALAGDRRWRPAGWGLLPVLVLALGALGAFGAAEPARTGGVQVHAELHQLRACTRLTYVTPAGVQPAGVCESLGPAYYDNSARAAVAIAVAIPPPAGAGDPPPISWDWQGDADWSAVAAATAAAALLLGLAAFVRTVFPR